MLALTYGGVGLLAVAVMAITFFVMSPPTDYIRNEIVAQVKRETGRELAISGPASFTIFPSLGVRIADVSLSSPPSMGGDPLLNAAGIEVGVRLMPLLRQEIAVDRLVLDQPVFSLRVDSNGRNNWEMTERAADSPVRYAQAETGNDTLKDFSDHASAPARPRRSVSGMSDVSLADIRILSGTVNYSDERSGAAFKAESLEAQLALPGMAHPLDARGSFVAAGEKIDFDAKLTSPQDLEEQRPARLVANVAGKPFSFTYDGSVSLDAAVGAEGAISGNAASVRQLAKWLGVHLPRVSGYRDVTFSGQLRAANDKTSLTDASLKFDGATASGSIDVTTSGPRPHVTANLRVADLDLDNYVQHGAGEGNASEPNATPETAPAAPAPSEGTQKRGKPSSIEDLLEEPGPKVKGYTQREGWSGEPVDLTYLGELDADAKLTVAGLTYSGMHVDSSLLTVALKDRMLKTNFDEVKLYGGSAHGFVTVDGTGTEAAIAANFSASGVAAQPFLRDGAGIDWLAGDGDLELAVSGRGGSETSIIQSLNGKANVGVRNGAIIGFNLGGAMRALQNGKVPDFEGSASEKTDFSQLAGSFVITDGVAKNDDMKLASPLLRATGAGTIDLPQRSLDYTLKPKLVASAKGEGGEESAAGIEVPVHVTGPWDKPDISPDIEGAINNPGTMEAVKELGKQFKGKNAGEVVQDLFGKGDDGEPSKAEKLLQKFLGR